MRSAHSPACSCDSASAEMSQYTPAFCSVPSLCMEEGSLEGGRATNRSFQAASVVATVNASSVSPAEKTRPGTVAPSS